jgi:RimJ/RimL family protein N-acetyltransferase
MGRKPTYGPNVCFGWKADVAAHSKKWIVLQVDVHLRTASTAHLAAFFRFHRQLLNDGESEPEFCRRWLGMLEDPSFLIRTILADGRIAGYIASFPQLGTPSVSYWLDQRLWGRGVASAALRKFLPLVAERPLYARAAYDNDASHRVLEKSGFKIVDRARYFSKLHGEEIEEVVFALT